MIAPTSFYKSLPALQPEEAGQLICDAIIDKPKRVASRLGTFSQATYSLSPKVFDQLANTIYKLFPEKDPKEKEEEKKAKEEGREPSGDGKKDEDVPAEGVALAYLMRGVYF
jgi:hypothetical protein